jgi:hypothetical protein
MVSAPTQGIKVYDPEYRLYESFMEHLHNFNPPETALQIEFSRSLAHPLLLLRMQTEKLANRIPVQLKQPSPENERSAENISNLIDNFHLIRHLACNLLLKQSCEKQLEDCMNMLEIEQGTAGNWKVNDVIQPLPQNTGYQNCLLKSKQSKDI